jgi:hypothetical protein
MRFSLPLITGAAVLTAQNPEIGVESTIWASPVEVFRVGTVRVDAAGVAAWEARPGIVLPVLGLDLHLRADDGAIGGLVAPSVTLDVTLDDDVETTAVASLLVPSWVSDPSITFPVGSAVDFVPTGLGNSAKLIVEVLGIDSSAGLPANTEWSVWASPPAANFIQLGWKRGANAPYQVPGVVQIADGYRAVAATKKGRQEQVSYSFEFAHVSAMGGMARYNGHRISVLEKVIKDKAVHTENIVFTGYRPSASPSRGDGNDEVVESSEGVGEDHLVFIAG